MRSRRARRRAGIVGVVCASLAALLAYYGFVAIFPSLLLLVTIFGLLLRNDPRLQERVLQSRRLQRALPQERAPRRAQEQLLRRLRPAHPVP